MTFKKGQIGYWTGKQRSEETKRKMSEMAKGDKNPMWIGGRSFESYDLSGCRILRESIRQRDEYTCKICGLSQSFLKGRKLDTHHIDYNKKNNNPTNLISLCHSCHSKTNINREYWRVRLVSYILENSRSYTVGEIQLVR